jgi:hypothetical protein
MLRPFLLGFCYVAIVAALSLMFIGKKWFVTLIMTFVISAIVWCLLALVYANYLLKCNCNETAYILGGIAAFQLAVVGFISWLSFRLRYGVSGL